MKRVLLQLDTDPLPSSFDRIVAVDAGIDEVVGYGNVTTENVEPLIHGAMFTRGIKDLKHTAIFIGGSLVSDGESLLQRVQQTFFGPVRVSVMMDSNGSNTTAAAAVLTAAGHVELDGSGALVLGGTGPVGQRAAQLLALHGSDVRVASRSLERAGHACDEIGKAVPEATLTPCETGTTDGLATALEGVHVIIAAGKAGTQLLSAEQRRQADGLQVALDLNAVPPAGIEDIEPADKGTERDGVTCYGAIGVGGTKMAIHKACLQRLFETNDLVLDTQAVYDVGKTLMT